MTIKCAICGDEITSMLVDKSAAGDLGILLTKHLQYRHMDTFTTYLAEVQLLMPMIPYWLMMYKHADLTMLPDNVLDEIDKCREILSKTLAIGQDDKDNDEDEDEIALAPVKLEVTDNNNISVLLNINDIWIPIINEQVKSSEDGKLETTVTSEDLEKLIETVLNPNTETMETNPIQ